MFAKPISMSASRHSGFDLIPISVTQLRDQRQSAKGLAKALEVLLIFLSSAKRPGELHQHGPKPAGLEQWFDTVFENPHIVSVENPFVGEDVIQLGGELKTRDTLDPLHPQTGQLGPGRPVERGVDLDHREIVRQIGSLMKTSRSRRRIDHTPPILGRTNPRGRSGFSIVQVRL